MFDLGLNERTGFHISAQNKYKCRKTAEMKVEMKPALRNGTEFGDKGMFFS